MGESIPAKLWRATQQNEMEHGPLEMIFHLESFKERFDLKRSDRLIVGISAPHRFFRNSIYYRLHAGSLDEAVEGEIEPLSQMRFPEQLQRHYTCQRPSLDEALRNPLKTALDYALKRQFWSYLKSPVQVFDITAWAETEP